VEAVSSGKDALEKVNKGRAADFIILDVFDAGDERNRKTLKD